MSIEEIKIHNCNNNTTLFNTDDWVKYDDFIKFVKDQQQKIDQLEKEVDFYKSVNQKLGMTNNRVITEKEQLKERNKELERGFKLISKKELMKAFKSQMIEQLLKQTK